MSHIPFHPAPGFGDLLPGSFVVPQNPIHPDGTPLVPSVQAASGGAPVYRPKMGDLLPGSFVVPQNPLMAALMATPAADGGDPSRAFSGSLSGTGSGGLGCSSCGGANFYGMSGAPMGLGTVDDTGGTFGPILTWAQTPGPLGLPNWAVYGGGALLLYMLIAPGGSDYYAQSRALRSQHRGYKRLARRTSARLSEAAA